MNFYSETEQARKNRVEEQRRKKKYNYCYAMNKLDKIVNDEKKQLNEHYSAFCENISIAHKLEKLTKFKVHSISDNSDTVYMSHNLLVVSISENGEKPCSHLHYDFKLSLKDNAKKINNLDEIIVKKKKKKRVKINF